MMKNMTATTEPKDKPIEELKALRERVAGLTGPGREVDEDIHRAFFPDDETWLHGEPIKLRDYPPGRIHILRDGLISAYTASIDAALALVEKRGLDPQLILEMALERVALENYRRDEFVFFIARAVIVETIAAELYPSSTPV